MNARLLLVLMVVAFAVVFTSAALADTPTTTGWTWDDQAPVVVVDG